MSELKREGKQLDLIIVDYMQLIKPNESIPREQQISQISRSLKALARELQLPVVALSQLNREAEKRVTPMPSAIPSFRYRLEDGKVTTSVWG